MGSAVKVFADADDGMTLLCDIWRPRRIHVTWCLSSCGLADEIQLDSVTDEFKGVGRHANVYSVELMLFRFFAFRSATLLGKVR